MTGIHEDAGQVQRSGGIIGFGHELGLQLRDTLPGRRILGHRRLYLHIGPGHENSDGEEDQYRQIENARNQGALLVPQTPPLVQASSNAPNLNRTIFPRTVEKRPDCFSRTHPKLRVFRARQEIPAVAFEMHFSALNPL